MESWLAVVYKCLGSLLCMLLTCMQWMLNELELVKAWQSFSDDCLKLKQYLCPRVVDFTVNIVVTYSDRHNPSLPWTLVRDLNQMSPDEFLAYITNEDKMGQTQRESLMIDEMQRRRTFLARWPHSDNSNLSATRMAQAGFYYLGHSDLVQCVYCRGKLHKWENEDNPIDEHERYFPFCSFLSRNRGRRPTLEQTDLSCIAILNSDVKDLANLDPSAAWSRLGIDTSRAHSIEYAREASRMRTFHQWPFDTGVSAARLCEAGFYYTGSEDQVRCFFCAGGLRNWSCGDDPWEMHARWFPSCPFLNRLKGDDYICRVHEQTPAGRKSQTPDQVEMVKICQQLGHCKKTIDAAILNNGGPFKRIGDMIDALYKLEEEIDHSDPEDTDVAQFSPNSSSQLSPPQPSFHDQSCQPSHSDISNIPLQCDDTGGTSQLTEDEDPLLCKRCRRAQLDHLGLPCGHLIFCDTCAAEEKAKCRREGYIPKCPCKNCGKPLTGIFKVYFA